MIDFRHFWSLFALLVCLNLSCQKEGSEAPETTCVAGEGLVGIGYSLWFPPHGWENVWDLPELGKYQSKESEIISQHAAWLEEACVDFILLDLSNNIEAGPDRPDLLAIEEATEVLVDNYRAHERHLKVVFMLGIDGNPANITTGKLQTKVDSLYQQYFADGSASAQGDIFLHYEGKPLLVVYVWAPSPFQNGLPQWTDERFTVRFMSGWLDAQPALLSGEACQEEPCQSRYGFWSWWDRSPQSYAVDGDGEPEFMVVSAAYPGDGGWADEASVGRRHGQTFKEQWGNVFDIRPHIVLINSFNEWVRPEEQDPEFSNDIEPSMTLQHAYLELLSSQIAKFKGL